MSLPFLKKKDQSVAGMIISHRKPDAEPEEVNDDGGLRSCARDLIEAIHAHDEARAAEAMRAAFEILESQPHEEADHSFDAQNQKAAE